jgi:hypothetical protein
MCYLFETWNCIMCKKWYYLDCLDPRSDSGVLVFTSTISSVLVVLRQLMCDINGI